MESGLLKTKEYLNNIQWGIKIIVVKTCWSDLALYNIVV